MTSRSVLWILIALGLGGCGFTPLLGGASNEAVAEELGRIEVRAIADRSGQILRNHLMDDLSRAGRSGPPLYTLEIRLFEPRQEIAIRRDESASRIAYTAQAAFTLRDIAGRSVYSGSSTASSTFEATNSEFASIAAQRGARDRAMQEISADIRQQIAGYFARNRLGLNRNATESAR